MPPKLSAEERKEQAEAYGIVVDACDEWLLYSFTWSMRGGYASTTIWNKEDGTQSYALLHHCIVGQPIDGSDVDHIDRNKMNNRRDNLRYVTHAVNSRNREPSEYIQETPYGRFQVRVMRDGKRINVGNFATYDEAVKARNACR